MEHFLTITHDPIEGYIERSSGQCSCGAWLDYLHEGVFLIMSAVMHGEPRCPAVGVCVVELDRQLVRP